MSAIFSPSFGHSFSTYGLPTPSATKVALYFQQLTHCFSRNSFVFTLICVAPGCAYPSFNSQPSAVNCPVPPLVVALPYGFALTPFAAAFTHCELGGGVAIPILKPRRKRPVKPGGVSIVSGAYNWPLCAHRSEVSA